MSHIISLLVIMFSFLFQIWKQYNITTNNLQSQCLGRERKYIILHNLFGDKYIQNCPKIDSTIYMIMIYYWDKKIKRRLHMLEAYIIKIKRTLIWCLLWKGCIFFLQMTAIALVSIINHYHIDRLHLFWDTLYFSENNKLQREVRSFSAIYCSSTTMALAWNYSLIFYFKKVVDNYIKLYDTFLFP